MADFNPKKFKVTCYEDLENIYDNHLNDYYKWYTSKEYKKGEFSDLDIDDFVELIEAFMKKQKFLESLPVSTYKEQEDIIKMLMATYEDTQKNRIADGNRIVAQFKITIGDDPSMKISDNDEKVLKILAKDYKRITDFIVDNHIRLDTYFKKQRTGLFLDKYMYIAYDAYNDKLNIEANLSKIIENTVKSHPINEFKNSIIGLGPITCGYIIRYLNPYLAPSPASYHSYCGYGVIDGKGVSLRNKNSRKLEFYLDKDEILNLKKSLGYNSKIKKSLYVFATSIMMQKSNANNVYFKIYENKKNFYTNKYPDRSKQHIHLMAVRYMVKQFLTNLWVFQRQIENLPTTYKWDEKLIAEIPLEKTSNVQMI